MANLVTDIAAVTVEELPAEWGARDTKLDLRNKHQEVTSDYKVVANGVGEVNWLHTIARIIEPAFVVETQDAANARDPQPEEGEGDDRRAPDTPRIANIDANVMAGKWTVVKIRVAQFFLSLLAAKSEINLRARSSDIVRYAPPANGTEALILYNAAIEFAKRIVNAVASNHPKKAELMSESEFTTLGALACGIHRKMFHGPNWSSEDGARPNTEAGKICKIAEGNEREFREWARDKLHDAWHFVTDEDLEELCTSMADKGDKVFQPDTVYNGMNVAGKRLYDALGYTVAHSSRYPPGALGKSRVILGCDIIVASIQLMEFKAKVPGSSAVSSGVVAFQKAFAATGIQHDTISKVTENLKSTIAYAYGILSIDPVVKAKYDENPSVTNLTKINAYESGVQLGREIQGMKTVPAAVAQAIGTFLRHVNEAFTAAANQSASLAWKSATDDLKEDVVIPETDADIAAKRSHEAQMAFAKAMAGRAT